MPLPDCPLMQIWTLIFSWLLKIQLVFSKSVKTLEETWSIGEEKKYLGQNMDSGSTVNKVDCLIALLVSAFTPSCAVSHVGWALICLTRKNKALILGFATQWSIFVAVSINFNLTVHAEGCVCTTLKNVAKAPMKGTNLDKLQRMHNSWQCNRGPVGTITLTNAATHEGYIVVVSYNNHIRKGLGILYEFCVCCGFPLTYY